MSSGNSPEEIAREKKKYIRIFIYLGILTAVTVGVSYLEVPPTWAIVLALAIASLKAGLVAANFMHLISERRLIYFVLLLTVFFFLVLLWAPLTETDMYADMYES